MSDTIIFKLLGTAEWAEACRNGVYEGSAADHADGFVHFSAADQVAETAARHFVGQGSLTLLAVDAARLGARLRWEASRGGALFPHLYGALPLDAVLVSRELPVDASASPDELAAAVTAMLDFAG